MAGPKKRADVTIDFNGVESGGRSVPDGEYLIEVLSVEEKETNAGDSTYLAWKWKVVDGAYKGATIYDNTSLKATALWRLKSLLECLGMEASGKLSLNFPELRGKRLLAEVANETYQGKQKPRIAGFLRGIDTAPAAPADGIKVGAQVSFEYEGSQMSAKVTSLDGSKVVVLVEVDGEQEEWELDRSDLTLA